MMQGQQGLLFFIYKRGNILKFLRNLNIRIRQIYFIEVILLLESKNFLFHMPMPKNFGFLNKIDIEYHVEHFKELCVVGYP